MHFLPVMTAPASACPKKKEREIFCIFCYVHLVVSSAYPVCCAVSRLENDGEKHSFGWAGRGGGEMHLSCSTYLLGGGGGWGRTLLTWHVLTHSTTG